MAPTEDCVGAGGVVGPAGSVCDGTTGNCVLPPGQAVLRTGRWRSVLRRPGLDGELLREHRSPAWRLDVLAERRLHHPGQLQRAVAERTAAASGGRPE
jgi:hypothetical protein